MKKIGFLVFLFLVPQIVGASNINQDDKYAWGENIGWIDFSGVEVNESKLSGYAFSENIGWISMNCLNNNTCDSAYYGVTNDSEGNLDGYAWGENIGWIDFSGVKIEEGIFYGYAYSGNVGYISFNCENTETCGDINFKVSTTWIKNSTQSSGSNSGGSSSGSRSVSNSNTGGEFASSDTTYVVPDEDQPATSILEENKLSNIEIDLEFGMQHEYVRKLQKFLNSSGYILAESGPGSPGNETDYFGTLTRSALAKYQADNDIKPSAGYFGPITRAFLALKGF